MRSSSDTPSSGARTPGRGPEAGRSNARLAEAVRERILPGLADLLRGALDAIDDSLFELANNARSNNEQNRHFEAMRDIRLKRKQIEQQFSASVTALFRNPPAISQQTAATKPAPGAPGELSLVSHDQLEKQVALDAMITKADTHFEGTLLQLQARFSYIYASTSAPAPVNPLTPRLICEAFEHAIKSLNLDIQDELVVLKQFDRYVVANLGMLLDEANRLLIHAGVLPDYRHATRKTGPARDSARDRSGQPRQCATASHSNDFLQQLTTLLGHKTADTHAPSTSAAFVVPGRQLADALPFPAATLYTPSPGNLSAGTPVQIDLQGLIQSALAEQGTQGTAPAALDSMDENLVDLVAMLFDFIIDDQNLSAPMQVLISRLQIPILKVVMHDRQFFNNPSHPARRLLNALAHSGVGWNHCDDKAQDRLYSEMHRIVEHILKDAHQQPALYEQLNEEFQQFLERENRKAALVEQRTREAERGRIKSRKAEETVDRILAEKTTQHQLPQTIFELLTYGWRRVMFLAYLRDDTEHRWQACVDLLDTLIWCLRPHADDAARDQWVREVPGLLKTLRAGLQDVSYRSAELDAIMATVKAQLTQAFRQNIDLAPVQTPAHESSAPNTDDRTGDEALSEHLARIEQLSPGDWLEFRLINGTVFRCKLSTVIEEADCCVFVNRMGLKVIEKTRGELAQELSHGRLSILEKEGLIDRALTAVADTLRRQA